jgi:PucR C-terminal helix-turn-helix domain/GGDEF-like domain
VGFVPAGEDATVANLRRASGDLASRALQRMEQSLPWYRTMSAQDRAWVGLIAQAAISAFINWYRKPPGSVEITADVLGTAPRELASSISLQHTLEMTRMVVEVVEESSSSLASSGAEPELREAVLRYSRDVAFAFAQVYAVAAESRGAWDARLEALVVDGVLRGADDDELRSRAAALAWGQTNRLCVIAGRTPAQPESVLLTAMRRAVRTAGGDLLVGIQGERLIVIAGHPDDPLSLVTPLLTHLGSGPVVTGPVVDGLMAAGTSARAAISGLAAAAAWPEAPRPVSATELLPERVLNGDPGARAMLVEEVYIPLQAASPHILETVAAYLDGGGSLERTARALFIHPNTVRYRLARVSEVTRLDPTKPRDAFTLRIAITAGRLAVGLIPGDS